MLSHLKNYFTFSRTERRGSIVFIIIILLLITVLYSMDYIFTPKQTDFSAFEKEIDSFYAARVLAQQEFKDSLEDVYQKNKENYHTKYKASYNTFNKVKAVNQGFLPSPIGRRAGDEGPSPSRREGVGGWAAEVIELNTADTFSIMKLHGIGKVFASRIIKYRNMLGGFAFKEQLKEVYGVDSVLYQSIQAHISVNPEAIQKININFADAQVMGKHPYLKYDKANAITYYRKQAGNFESIEDIRNAVFLTDDQYAKLEPYLSIE